MKRLLFRVVTVFSLLLWLHAVVAAVFEFKGYNDGYVFSWTSDAPRRAPTFRPTVTFDVAGFKAMDTMDAYSHPVRAYFVPHWVGVIVLAIIPTLWLRNSLSHRRRRKRANQNQCPDCGYDLRAQLALSEQRDPDERATPNRCPECGMVFISPCE